ncbi:hypothetical protein Tco_0871616 [Tanacetum coccineum]
MSSKLSHWLIPTKENHGLAKEIHKKKRRRADGASGSDHPPKKLREDHDTSGDVGASTGEKSLAVIQELFERSTLNVEVGITAAATMPFVTYSVTLSLEHSSHHSSTNVADAEVTSIVRSSVPPPPVLTAAVVTTAIVAEADVAGPSQPVDVEVSTDTFFISQEMDSET